MTDWTRVTLKRATAVIVVVLAVAAAIGGVMTAFEHNGKEWRFDGVVEQVAWNCVFDATCSLRVSGKTVIVGSGRTQAVWGAFHGPKDEVCLGKRVSVYCRAVSCQPDLCTRVCARGSAAFYFTSP